MLRTIAKLIGLAALSLLATTAVAQTAPTTGPSYEETFKDLYNHLYHTYPCLEMKHIDWEKVGDELLPQVQKVSSQVEFGILCRRLVARLQDSHAELLPGLWDPPAPTDLPQFDPGFACLLDDRDQPVVYYVDPNSPADHAGITVGMTITAINMELADKAMERSMKRISNYWGYSSDRYLRYDAARDFMRVQTLGQVVKIEAEDPDGQPQQFLAAAKIRGRYLPRLPVPIDGIRDDENSYKKLSDDIGYIYVRRISDDLPKTLDDALTSMPKIRGLILDDRGNSGGGFDERALENFKTEADNAEPDRPHFKGAIALLLDERTISAAEGWASWFIAKKRARTFGSTTAGASSRKEDYELINHAYKVRIPVKAYTGYLDRPIEFRGLEPNEKVRQNAKDLAAGKDPVLETARKWLNNEIKKTDG